MNHEANTADSGFLSRWSGDDAARGWATIMGACASGSSFGLWFGGIVIAAIDICHSAFGEIVVKLQAALLTNVDAPGAVRGSSIDRVWLRITTPVSPCEILKIGGGTPPVLTNHGWLIIYHGVSEVADPGNDAQQLCYSAGVMVLTKEHPRVILYRSTEPVLTPLLPQERHGTISNVVFPTGIDRRDDLGSPDRFDVYYGMADNRIGVASLDIPDSLPPDALADPS